MLQNFVLYWHGNSMSTRMPWQSLFLTISPAFFHSVRIVFPFSSSIFVPWHSHVLWWTFSFITRREFPWAFSRFLRSSILKRRGFTFILLYFSSSRSCSFHSCSPQETQARLSGYSHCRQSPRVTLYSRTLIVSEKLIQDRLGNRGGTSSPIVEVVDDAKEVFRDGVAKKRLPLSS